MEGSYRLSSAGQFSYQPDHEFERRGGKGELPQEIQQEEYPLAGQHKFPAAEIEVFALPHQ
jgi:hypothetical protein